MIPSGHKKTKLVALGKSAPHDVVFERENGPGVFGITVVHALVIQPSNE
jgi:hypothetical protein